MTYKTFRPRQALGENVKAVGSKLDLLIRRRKFIDIRLSKNIPRKMAAYLSPRSRRIITIRRTSNDKRMRHALSVYQNQICAGLTNVHGRIHRLCTSIPKECDHIIELRHYGLDEGFNLQMLCHTCHVIKTNANRVSQRLL
jgi:5-methylcytosine-specific restriction endonuclease McrA